MNENLYNYLKNVAQMPRENLVATKSFKKCHGLSWNDQPT